MKHFVVLYQKLGNVAFAISAVAAVLSRRNCSVYLITNEFLFTVECVLQSDAAVYELFSIMVHSGGASGGHYYAYIKCVIIFCNTHTFSCPAVLHVFISSSQVLAEDLDKLCRPYCQTKFAISSDLCLRSLLQF